MRDHMPKPRDTVLKTAHSIMYYDEVSMHEPPFWQEQWHLLKQCSGWPAQVVSSTLGCCIAIGVMHLIGVL